MKAVFRLRVSEIKSHKLAGSEKITENDFIRNIYGIGKGRIFDIHLSLLEIKRWIKDGTLREWMKHYNRDLLTNLPAFTLIS